MRDRVLIAALAVAALGGLHAASAGRALAPPERAEASPTPTPTPTVIAKARPRWTAVRSAAPRATPTPARGGCVAGGARPCLARGPASDLPCGALPLTQTSIKGTTVSGTNLLGNSEELSCGNNGGGKGAPERVYIFTPPAPGKYEISVQGDKFRPLLHLRSQSCQGAFLACADDPTTSRRPTLTIDVGAPLQPIAIGIDGDGASQRGGFELTVRALLPDLVVDLVQAPPAAIAGQQVKASARVRNAGDIAAGPFRIEFFYASDATLSRRLGIEPASCQLGGLAPGASVECPAPTGLTAPRVGAGSYVIGALADADDDVGEANEQNNSTSVAAAITLIGTRFEQALFRAGDGTAYQVLRVVPIDDVTPAERYRVTQLAGTSGTIDTAFSNATTVLTLGLEVDYSATVSATPLFAPGTMRRTMRLRPNDAGPMIFEAAGGGRLRFGAGMDMIDVCADPSRCGASAAAALLPVSSSADGFPAACTSGARLGFGVPGGGSPACSFPSKVTTVATRCETEPADGFGLSAGEVIVFVYATGLEPFSVGLGAFGINADDSNDCGPGQVVDVAAPSQRSSRQGLLTFIEASRPTAALDGVRSVAVSGDGGHVYAGGPQGLVTLARNPTTGRLAFVETVTGAGQVRAVVVSPDSRHVYAAGTSGLVAYTRNVTTGRLTAIQSDPVVTTATAMVMPPDGLSLYAFSNTSFALRQRTVASGLLTAVNPGFTSMTALAITNTRAFTFSNTADVFSARIGLSSRAPQTGLLTGVTSSTVEGRFVINTRAMIAPADGSKVYVAANSGAGTTPGLRVFTVRLEPAFPTPTPGPFFTSLEASIGPSADMVEGVVDVTAMALSPDERYLFIAADATSEALVSGATLIALDTAALNTLADIKRDGSGSIDGLSGAAGLAVSADGRHVYVAGPGDDAIAIFAVGRGGGSATPTSTPSPTPPNTPSPTRTPTSGALANDRCENAIPINGSPIDVTLATQSPTDPVPSCGNGSRARSVWYTTSSPNQEFFTRGSTYDTVVSIYTGSCGALMPVGCNDDELAQIRTSRVAPGASAPTYFIMVTSFDGRAGQLELRQRAFVAPF